MPFQAELAFLHQRLAGTAAIYTFVIAIWAAYAFARGRGVDGNFLGAVLVGELLLVAEVLLGSVLMLGAHLAPGRWIHLLYGLLAAVMWPFIFTYTRGTSDRRESLLFAAGSLFLWGLVLRAATTAHPLP